MRRHRSLPSPTGAFVAALLLAACSDRPDITTPRAGVVPTRPQLTVFDAATGGRAGFYILPPLVADPGPFSGTFDAELTNLSVKICQLSAGTCAGDVKTFGSGSASEQITVDLLGQSYNAVWASAALDLSGTGTMYRMQFWSGSILLGYADLYVVAKQRDLRDVPAGYVGVVAGAPFVIKFRVDEETVGTVSVLPSSATINVGGTQLFTATVTDLHGDAMSGRTVDFSSSNTGVATLSPSSGSTSGSGQASTTASGVAAGSATIVASTGGVSGSGSLTVNAVISDVAPTVTSKSPAAFAANVPRTAQISVTFSEPVNVTSNWIVVNCGGVQRTPSSDLLVTGGPTTFTITPTTLWPASTSCTATIIAGFVTDQDSNDPPDAMAAPVVWSFTTAAF